MVRRDNAMQSDGEARERGAITRSSQPSGYHPRGRAAVGLQPVVSWWNFGGGGQNRTVDLRVMSPSL
jgi:hypothetical protein